MDESRRELAAFIERVRDQQTDFPDDADLFDGLGIDGDDAFEFMEAFSKSFSVDLTGYRWYFHHAEEGWNYGGLIFAPPNRRVKAIPITKAILLEAIRTKAWPLRYPEHRLPSRRWDIFLNQLLAVPPVVLAGLWLWRRFSH